MYFVYHIEISVVYQPQQTGWIDKNWQNRQIESIKIFWDLEFILHSNAIAAF
jgi:hypothetical protein